MAKKIELYYIHQFDFCDRGHFMIVKGISILAALIAYCCSTFLGISYLNFLIPLATAVFMLCSGYGVSESFERKGGMPHYWENKFIKIWIPSLLVLLVFALIKTKNAIGWISTFPVALKGNMLYLVFGNYLAFWLTFSLFDGKAARTGILFAMAVVAFVFVKESLLQMVMFCFPVGVLVSQMGWKRKIRRFQWRGKLVMVLLSAAIGVAGWFLAPVVESLQLRKLILGITYMGDAVFLMTGVYCLQQIPVFGVFAPFGYMSYMLFLVYNNMFKLATGKEDWRIFAAVAVATVVVSLAGTWLIDRFMELNKNLRRRTKTRLKGSMW